MTDAVVFCDGACEPKNPGGIATFGWVAYWKDQIRARDCGVVCEGDGATNNVAEYTALIRALKFFLSKNFHGPLTVKSDSQLMVNQMSGKWAVKAPTIVPLNREALELACQFKDIFFEWIPREQNEQADQLSKQAYFDYRKSRR